MASRDLRNLTITSKRLNRAGLAIFDRWHENGERMDEASDERVLGYPAAHHKANERRTAARAAVANGAGALRLDRWPVSQFDEAMEELRRALAEAKAARSAEERGMELFELRGTTRPDYL